VVEPADPSAHQQSITMQQVDIYGETWADRLGRLLRAYNLSQAKLASVIGLSAPMLSQLISGQRVKISNPAVYGRIVQLEEQLSAPSMHASDPVQRARVLAEITASNPSLTTRSGDSSLQTTVSAPAPTPDARPAVPAMPGSAAKSVDERLTALTVLARAAGAAELRRVAASAEALGARELARLLAAAADLP